MVHSEQTRHPSCRAFSYPIVRTKLKSLCHMMPVASTSSRTRRLVKTISWTLSMISGIAASIGRPERGALHVDVRLWTI